MLTRTVAILVLLFISTAGSESIRPRTALPKRPLHARVVDDSEGCRVPPPRPEPVAPASCDDEGRP